MHSLLPTIILLNIFGRISMQGEILTPISKLKNLIYTETFLIDTFEHYLDVVSNKVEMVRSNLQLMREENMKAHSDVDKYLMNPLQLFSLIRRMHQDWVHLVEYMEEPIGSEYLDIIKNKSDSLPTLEDMDEVASSMYRIQNTYGMIPMDMAQGMLYGVQYRANLSPIDCFAMGYFLYRKGLLRDAGNWFYAALNLFEDDDPMNDVFDFEKEKILHMYALVLAKEANSKEAVSILSYLLELDPYDFTADQEKSNSSETILNPESINSLYVEMFREACRSKMRPRMPNLYCIYNRTTHPFLTLAPYKMEIISLDPYMVFYHDVLTDYEMETLKTAAETHIARSQVHAGNGTSILATFYRSSKSTTFEYQSNWFSDKMSQMVEDLTGFDLEKSNFLHVMNYGAGEHYYPHTDYFEFPKEHEESDRIATVLFYLNDVELGGATVFTALDIGIYPKKGSCLLWYNLDSRGEGDWRTTHASCPVIVGSKWIATNWINEREQVFRRPCNVE